MGLTDKLRAVTEDSRKAAQSRAQEELQQEQPENEVEARDAEEEGGERQAQTAPTPQPEETREKPEPAEAKELEELRRQLARVKAKRRRAKKAVTMHIPVIMADAIDEVYRMRDVVKGEMAVEAWDAYLEKMADELEDFEWPPPDGFRE